MSHPKRNPYNDRAPLGDKRKNIQHKKNIASFLRSSGDDNPQPKYKGESNSPKNDDVADNGKCQKPEVKICCDCKARTGLRPCVTPQDSDDFPETSNCFFKNLPPLVFAPYTQCPICGRRFDNTDFEQHVLICDKKFQLPPTPQIQGRQGTMQSQRISKYNPPFIMKTLLMQPVDMDDCLRDEDLCGFKNPY